MTFDLSKVWQLYESLPRPLLRWVCIPGTAWVFFCDWFGFPMDSAVRGVLLAFVAAVYGLRGWEKLRQGSE
jgi:hypothetical protein